MNDYNDNNEIIDISSDISPEISSSNQSELLEKRDVKPKKKKKSLKDKWDELSKKKKRTIIIVCSLVLLLIIGIIIFFVFFNKKEEKPIPKEDVIIVKDNYRYENGSLVFLDKSDKEIGRYKCSVENAEKCLVKDPDYSDDKFERVISVRATGEEIPKASPIFSDRFVFVEDNGEINLYDIKEKEKVLKVKGIKIYNTEKDLVVIIDENNKYGLIDIDSTEFNYLIRPSYDYLGIVNASLVYLVAQDKDSFYVIDSTGKSLTKNITTTIMSANSKYIVGLKNNSYSLYDYNYEELVSDYDYISLVDGAVCLVKGNRLYILDDKLNKVNQDGIRLENSDYVKKYVYDDNNKLLETKKAYDVVVKDNVAAVTVGTDTKTFNMLEAGVNSLYAYMSYYDGVLYFYNDIEKDELIGTYKCNNKNTITSATSPLVNCTIYSKKELYSGIYNNEYVFVYDNMSASDGLYYLYSIKEKKVKGTYSDIEIVNSSELSDTIKQVYTSSSYFIVKTAAGANKGNYGVITIDSSKVTGKVKFEFESITKYNSYYLGIKKDKTYIIYDQSFNRISNEFSYVKLYDKYYVGINNNKLNIYSYTDTLGKLESDLEVSNNEYELDLTNGFKITIKGQVYDYDFNGKVRGSINNEE